MEKIVNIFLNRVLKELIGMELIVLLLDLVLKVILKDKVIFVNLFHNSVYLKQLGMDILAKLIIKVVLKILFYKELFVCLMFLVKMVKYGVHPIYFVFVQMEHKIMEMYA